MLIVFSSNNIYQAWKLDRSNHFVAMSFLSLIKDSNDNSFPHIHLLNANNFFVTGKHFYNLAYKLHFLHTDLPTLHKRTCFSTTIPPLLIYLECSPAQCFIKKINIATIKFVEFCQQPSPKDLPINIANFRIKPFCCIRKYIKFIKVSFQVLIKGYMLLLSAKFIKTSVKKIF